MVPELIILMFRTAILYLVALFVFRVMGKRTLSKMGPFDLAVIIMLGEAVAVGMEDVKTPIWDPIGITLALGAMQYALTWFNSRYPWFEQLTQGRPAHLIHAGDINKSTLARERVSLADLFMELRQKGITSLDDVTDAYLEPTGAVSVIKADQPEQDANHKSRQKEPN